MSKKRDVFTTDEQELKLQKDIMLAMYPLINAIDTEKDGCVKKYLSVLKVGIDMKKRATSEFNKGKDKYISHVYSFDVSAIMASCIAASIADADINYCCPINLPGDKIIAYSDLMKFLRACSDADLESIESMSGFMDTGSRTAFKIEGLR